MLNLKVYKATRSVAASSRESFEYSLSLSLSLLVYTAISHIGLGNFGQHVTESGGLSACPAQASCRQYVCTSA